MEDPKNIDDPFFRTALIKDAVNKDYPLGAKDRGFAITVIQDFLQYLSEHGYDIK